MTAITVDDGVTFDTTRLQIQPIREDGEYGGSRLRITAALAGARIPIVVDVGFGDAIEPGAEDIDLPVLLDIPSPHLRAYPPETVTAEKLHAMVALGMANSHMKDYYDVWMLTRNCALRSPRSSSPSEDRRPKSVAVLCRYRSHPGSGLFRWVNVRSSPGSSRCGCFSGAL